MTQHRQLCQSCHSEISGELIHLGFSNIDVIYCNQCPNVLIIKDQGFYENNEIELPRLSAGEKGWQEYDRHLIPYFKLAEKLFPQCACGGRFEYMAAPRCPSCNEYILGKGYEDKPALRNTRSAFISRESVSI